MILHVQYVIFNLYFLFFQMSLPTMDLNPEPVKSANHGVITSETLRTIMIVVGGSLLHIHHHGYESKPNTPRCSHPKVMTSSPTVGMFTSLHPVTAIALPAQGATWRIGPEVLWQSAACCIQSSGRDLAINRAIVILVICQRL